MAKKEEEKEEHPFEGDIYHGDKHTVALWVHSEDAEDAEWHDLDFRSDVEGKKEALFDYLKRTFGEEVEIEEVDSDTYRVSDPLFAEGECLRDYKLS
jgi:hypothetical protein